MARLCGPGGLLFVPFVRSNLDREACQPVLFASMPLLLLLRTGRAPSPCSVYKDLPLSEWGSVSLSLVSVKSLSIGVRSQLERTPPITAIPRCILRGVGPD